MRIIECPEISVGIREEHEMPLAFGRGDRVNALAVAREDRVRDWNTCFDQVIESRKFLFDLFAGAPAMRIGAKNGALFTDTDQVCVVRAALNEGAGDATVEVVAIANKLRQRIRRQR
jgi:hypothetical protein